MTECVTVDCHHPGTVRGTYTGDVEPIPDVTYCEDCAEAMISVGEFTPDEPFRHPRDQVERVRALARRVDTRGVLFNGEMVRQLIEKALDGE